MTMVQCFGMQAAGLRRRLERSNQKMRKIPSVFKHHSKHSKESKYSARAELEQQYILTSEVLGNGSYGQVRLAKCKHTEEEVAVKFVAKRRVNKSALPRLQREAAIMRRIKHHAIVRLINDFEDDKEIILVLELCQGRELFQELEHTGGRFTARRTKRLLHQLLEAVEYLHEQGVCHRDIKLENVMCTADSDHLSSGDEMNDGIKLIDFGLARSMELHTECEVSAEPDVSENGLYRMNSKVGTVQYTAPQVLDPNTSYGKGCDVWAIGVLGYIMLTGAPPFKGKNAKEIAKSVQAGRIDFMHRGLLSSGHNAVDLLRKLLCTDELERLTAAEALQHPFFLDKGGAAAEAAEKDEDEDEDKDDDEDKTSSIISPAGAAATPTSTGCTSNTASPRVESLSRISSPLVSAQVAVPVPAILCKEEGWIVISSPLPWDIPRYSTPEAPPLATEHQHI